MLNYVDKKIYIYAAIGIIISLIDIVVKMSDEVTRNICLNSEMFKLRHVKGYWKEFIFMYIVKILLWEITAISIILNIKDNKNRKRLFK